MLTQIRRTNRRGGHGREASGRCCAFKSQIEIPQEAQQRGLSDEVALGGEVRMG